MQQAQKYRSWFAIFGLLLACVCYAPHLARATDIHPPTTKILSSKDLQDLIDKANQGDAVAQHDLARAYDTGQWVKQDYSEAAKWHRKAAEQGELRSQHDLGSDYLQGRGVPLDYEEAMKWFRKAADQGDSTGENDVGAMYSEGWGVKQDYADALRWYQKSAAQGDAYGEYDLSFAYAHGHGVAQNFVEAANWLRKSADQGVPEAQYNLGLYYERGLGVKQSNSEAMNWYSKSAKQGNTDAQARVHSLPAPISPVFIIFNTLVLLLLAVFFYFRMFVTPGENSNPKRVQGTISSSMTLFYKVIFPLLWGGGFGAGALTMWLVTMKDKHGAVLQIQTAIGVKLLFTAMWIAGVFFTVKLYGSIKKIRLDDNNLYISNYRREITVPRSSIAKVTELATVKPIRIALEFQRDTVFGKKILFMPKIRFLIWKQHPIVSELSQIPGQSKTADSSTERISSTVGINILKILCVFSGITSLTGAAGEIWTQGGTSSDPVVMQFLHTYGPPYSMAMGVMFLVFAIGLQTRARFAWPMGWALLFLTYLQIVGQFYVVGAKDFKGTAGPPIFFMPIAGALVIAYWGAWWKRQRDYFKDK